MERYIRGSSLNDGYKRFLLGEVNVVRTFVVYNDLRQWYGAMKSNGVFFGRMFLHRNAAQRIHVRFSHLLYGYYKEKGRLQHTQNILRSTAKA